MILFFFFMSQITQLAPISQLQEEVGKTFGRNNTIKAQDILDLFGVKYNEVLFVINGKVAKPTDVIEVGKTPWSMVSLSIGG